MSPTTTLRAACVQVASGEDAHRNRTRTGELFAEAASRGARLIVLPEKWNLIGESDVLRAGAEPIDGPSLTAVREWCREHDAWCVAGSIALREPREELLANASFLVAPDGGLVARYDKVHMFDVEVGGVPYRESDHERPGVGLDEALAEVDGVATVGLTVCYDLRFPELHRILALRGATVITVPAAFTMHTGKDHWEVLLRARAIENQCFVIGADVIGNHGGGKVSYGRSMIVDPWGLVLAQVPDDEGIAVADLDFERLRDVRAKLPSLASRVPAAYSWPTGH